MTAKKKSSAISRVLLNLLMAMPAAFNAVTQIARIIESDAKVARRSFVSLILLAFLCLTLVLSGWLCLLAILYLFLISLHLSAIISLSILFVLNSLLLVIVGLLMANAKNKLFFPSVRQLLIGRK